MKFLILVKLDSLAKIIVYSMAHDSVSFLPSRVSSPFTPGGGATPDPHNGLNEFLSSPLGNKPRAKIRTYLAGSRALDSLAKLIMCTESFFHPGNGGKWTINVNLLRSDVKFYL